MNCFYPDKIFDTYADVTPEFLLSMGKTTLLCDIDNTLAPYSMPVPDENLLRWFDGMRQAGIRLAFVSNNHADRVELFAKGLGIPTYPDSGKPSRRGIRQAMADFGSTTENTAFLGDQLLTDVLAARRSGIAPYIVPPIEPRENLFFRFKRSIENLILKFYYRRERKRTGSVKKR